MIRQGRAGIGLSPGQGIALGQVLAGHLDQPVRDFLV
jgi:hypothetical protein